MMRPVPARWFEVLAARADTSVVLEALATTRAVELEAPERAARLEEWSALGPGLAEYAALKARYARDWPAPGAAPSAFPQPPQTTLDAGLAVLRTWAQRCEPAIRSLQALDEQHTQTQVWAAALQAWDPVPIDFVPADLLRSDASVDACLVPGAAAATESLPSGVLQRHLPAAADATLILGPRAFILQKIVSSSGAQRALAVPAWLPASWDAIATAAEAQLQCIELRQSSQRMVIAQSSRELQLEQVLADLNRLRWVSENVHGLAASALLVRMYGWTCDRSGASLLAAIESSGARALLHFPTAPQALHPPLLLANPAWSRPFEIFSRAFGVPGRNEADPTPIVAIVAPLLFGYMFGDVGQGAVILCLGYGLRRYGALARLLMAGGAASMLFGVLFGSLFTLEGILPPLWLHPLQHPLVVLTVPLFAGAGLLLSGLALNLLGAWWRHALRDWCLHDASAVLAYSGLMLALFDRLGWWLVLLGSALAVVAPLLARERASAALAAVGVLIEHLLQLSINTLSFARVGAFALAHAGLSSAVVVLMQSAHSAIAQFLILLLGNLVILGMEALVVSIQTTRLLLFEFFTRFLTGSGRVFAALPPPPSAEPSH